MATGTVSFSAIATPRAHGDARRKPHGLAVGCSAYRCSKRIRPRSGPARRTVRRKRIRWPPRDTRSVAAIVDCRVVDHRRRTPSRTVATKKDRTAGLLRTQTRFTITSPASSPSSRRCIQVTPCTTLAQFGLYKIAQRPGGIRYTHALSNDDATFGPALHV